MLALAAAGSACKTHIYCPDPRQPGLRGDAAQDRRRLRRQGGARRLRRQRSTSSPTSSRTCPPRPPSFLACTEPLRPGANALAVSQDRLAEKAFHRRPRHPGGALSRRRDASRSSTTGLAELGFPAVLKTTRLGYDGKGQRIIRERSATRQPPSSRWRRSRWCSRPSFPFEKRNLGRRRPRHRRRGRRLRSGRERPPRPHPRDQHRAGRDLAGDRRGARGDRRADRHRARLCRRARRRVLRARPTASCWSTRSPRASTIPATGPRRSASPTSSSSTSAAICGWPLGDPTRLADVVMENLIGDAATGIERAGAARRAGAPLRQGRGPARPQDGPCQPDRRKRSCQVGRRSNRLGLRKRVLVNARLISFR